MHSNTNLQVLFYKKYIELKSVVLEEMSEIKYGYPYPAQGTYNTPYIHTSHPLNYTLNLS
jgi:hypothetical protein